MHTSGPYQAVDWRFSVRCDDPVVGAELARVLADLRTVGDDPGSWYDLRVSSNGAPASLTCESEELTAGPTSLAYATLLWHVNRGVTRTGQRYLLLHASAAEQDGRAVIMCAPMESGKTTLVAGLVLDGLRYLTDEAVAIDPTTLRISPYPKPLSVDAGSWPALPELRPDLPSGVAALSPEQWQVPVGALRPDAVSGGAQPAVLVLPRYEQGATTVLTPVGRAEAMAELLRNAFEPERARGRDVDVLARLVRACSCYRLLSGDRASAVLAVRQVLAQQGALFGAGGNV